MKFYEWRDVNDRNSRSPTGEDLCLEHVSKKAAKADFRAYAAEFNAATDWVPKLQLYKITVEEVK